MVTMEARPGYMRLMFKQTIVVEGVQYSAGQMGVIPAEAGCKLIERGLAFDPAADQEPVKDPAPAGSKGKKGKK